MRKKNCFNNNSSATHFVSDAKWKQCDMCNMQKKFMKYGKLEKYVRMVNCSKKVENSQWNEIREETDPQKNWETEKNSIFKWLHFHFQHYYKYKIWWNAMPQSSNLVYVLFCYDMTGFRVLGKWFVSSQYTSINHWIVWILMSSYCMDWVNNSKILRVTYTYSSHKYRTLSVCEHEKKQFFFHLFVSLCVDQRISVLWQNSD